MLLHPWLLVRQVPPKPLLPINVTEQHAKTKLGPCLSGHGIPFREMQRGNIKLFQEEGLEIGWTDRAAVYKKLRLGTRFFPATFNEELLSANEERCARRVVFFGKSWVRRVLKRIGAGVTEEKIQRLQPLCLAGVRNAHKYVDTLFEFKRFRRPIPQFAIDTAYGKKWSAHPISSPKGRSTTSFSNME